MSSIQGPSTNQAQQTADTGQPESKASEKQQKAAEMNSDAFDKALTKKTGNDEAKAPPKEDSLSDLFKKTATRPKQEKEKGDDSKGDDSGAEAQAAAGNTAKTGDTSATGKTAEVQAVDNKQMVDKIEKIADRIMVSAAGDVKEVKVDFKNSVLPGTEVTIRKDTNGTIRLDFSTTSTESFNMLTKGEGALMDTLKTKIGSDVNITIDMQDKGDGKDDSGDGRSRNQYEPENQDDQD